jgi:hypothetical protein
MQMNKKKISLFTRLENLQKANLQGKGGENQK